MAVANHADWSSSSSAAGSSTACVPKVLCIDDDPNVSEALARRLHSHGIEVSMAFCGMQGFWQAVTEKPNVIILDYSMPKGDGCQILECLKRNPQTANVPVIVLTGKVDAGLKNRMLKLGADRFFTEPVPFDALLDELSRYLGGPA
jgi:DNA-binding response OmpR family regulator